MTIADQLNSLQTDLDAWARENGGGAFIVSDLAHLWAPEYIASDVPRILIAYNGENIRTEYGVESNVNAALGRVDRHFIIAVTRGRGWAPKELSTLANTAQNSTDFLDTVEAIREYIRAKTDISVEAPVNFSAVRPMPDMASGKLYLDAYLIEFTVANQLSTLSADGSSAGGGGTGFPTGGGSVGPIGQQIAVPTTRLISTVEPLEGGGDLSADRTLSITKSGSNINGYLSGTDWIVFNSKQNSLGSLNGIVKGDGAGNFTVATSGTDYAPGYSGVPVGGIIAFAKSLTGTPAMPIGYVECNGQTLSDAASVYNGVVIPNLNGSTEATKRFLRGAASSGGTGGTATHTHSETVVTDNHFITTATPVATAVTTASVSTGASATIPVYYEVVFVIRTK